MVPLTTTAVCPNRGKSASKFDGKVSAILYLKNEKIRPISNFLIRTKILPCKRLYIVSNNRAGFFPFKLMWKARSITSFKDFPMATIIYFAQPMYVV